MPSAMGIPKAPVESFLFLNDGEETDTMVDENIIESVTLQTKSRSQGQCIPKMWVLLDSQSTADVYSNPDLLTNIREVKGSLTIYTQTGKGTTKLMGTVPGYGRVWYVPKGIANILSLVKVGRTHNCKITFDSNDGNRFEVTKKNGSKRIFQQSENILYYYDMAATTNMENSD